MGTKDDLLALGRSLKAAGYQVGENLAFGGRVGTHAPGSAHYTGDAIDINYDGHGQGFETSKLQAAVPLAQAAGLRVIWQTAGHYDHLHVDDRPGPDIGNVGGGPRSTTSTAAANVGLLPTAGDLIANAGHIIIIGAAVITGAALVVIGLNKAAGNPGAKAAKAAAGLAL